MKKLISLLLIVFIHAPLIGTSSTNNTQPISLLDWGHDQLSNLATYAQTTENSLIEAMHESLQKDLEEIGEHRTYYTILFGGVIAVITVLIAFNVYLYRSTKPAPRIDPVGFSGILSKQGATNRIPPPINTKHIAHVKMPKVPPAPIGKHIGKHTRLHVFSNEGYDSAYDIALSTIQNTIPAEN